MEQLILRIPHSIQNRGSGYDPAAGLISQSRPALELDTQYQKLFAFACLLKSEFDRKLSPPIPSLRNSLHWHFRAKNERVAVERQPFTNFDPGSRSVNC
jgi:hypothetical protein